jgi:tRNA modification GTPase
MAVDRDTIFALSSGRPPAAIAVVRLCGPQAGEALAAMIGRVPEPRRAALAKVRAPQSGEVIDEAIALFFPGPRTETGEDMAEIHLHGGRAVVAGVLEALGTLPGLRPAEPGEFTRRAFLNGRLDLTAVEALADLIYAETAAQRRQAYRHLKGWLGARAEAWRTQLIEALALVEAGIDFSDEGDVPQDLLGPALARAQELRADIAAALDDGRRGERLREGLAVAIAGPPNAGKSSLLNRIARREAAIVSPLPGTTRDVIEVHLDLGGYPVTLLDTAGIRESDDPVEREGVRRARERAAAADLILWVVDATTGGDDPNFAIEGRGDAPSPPVWLIRNKIDLLPQKEAGEHLIPETRPCFPISAREGTGLEVLLDALGAYAAETFTTGEPPLVTRERHRVALRTCLQALDRALAIAPAGREDLLAEELRIAARALGRLTGRVDVEEVLDVIFRDFCVGK